MAKNRKPEVDAAIAKLDFSKNDYQIVLETNMGPITLDLLPAAAPGRRHRRGPRHGRQPHPAA